VAGEAADFLLSRCTKGIESEDAGDGRVRVTAHGIGGHAAFPQGTDNAIGKLVRLMLADDGAHMAGAPALVTFLRLVERLTRTSDGSAIGIDTTDEVFGALTLNAGVVRTLEDGRCTITVDVRFPTSITADEVVATFERLAEEYGCTFEAGIAKEPFYMDPSLPEIQALLDTYREYAGRPDAEAFVIGGGTYARKFPRACAFGPHDPSVVDPAWVGIEHGPDEGVSEEVLRRGLKVYIVSIARLMELDLA
jgi:succinyl-diaminopimelate desuccinylase